jgi:hypothetical protein
MEKTLEFVDPRIKEFVEAASKTMMGGDPTALLNLAAKEAGELAQKTDNKTAMPGKDLEAGTREYPMGGFNPDRMTTRDSAASGPTKLDQFLSILEKLAPEEKTAKKAEGDQSPTTQPADETAAADGVGSPTSSPSASDKS